MRFESIHLVANLAQYDFENVVLLADDVDAIVTELCYTGGDGRFGRVECCEKLLFLARVLETALDASRRVVKNYEELDELLRVKWEGGGGSERKWDFVRDGENGAVNRVAGMVLSAEGGERCLGVVKAFYKRFSCKDEFRKVIGDVQRGLEWRRATGDYLSLRKGSDREVGSRLEALEKIKVVLSEDPKEVIQNAARWNLRTVAELASCGSFDSRSINKLLAGILVNIKTGSDEFLNDQLTAIRSLLEDKKVLESYQNLMKFTPFYEVNLELLRVHHRKLQGDHPIYDSNTILLCHLIYAKHQCGQFLKDFLNEQTFGGRENLELILAELQNFT